MKSLGGYYLSDEELNAAGFGRVGKNVKIHSKASLYGLENMFIGDNVRIDDFTVIIATGKMIIGSFVSIHNFCFFGAKNGILIEDFVTFAPGVKVFTASDDYAGNFMTGVCVPFEMTGGTHSSVEIRNHAILGAGSIVLPGCLVEEGCAVGALSLIKESLQPWGIYAGIPATRRKERSRKVMEMSNQLTYFLGKKC